MEIFKYNIYRNKIQMTRCTKESTNSCIALSYYTAATETLAPWIIQDWTTGYLPLSGGEMNGHIVFNNTDGYGSYTKYRTVDGVYDAYRSSGLGNVSGYPSITEEMYKKDDTGKYVFDSRIDIGSFGIKYGRDSASFWVHHGGRQNLQLFDSNKVMSVLGAYPAVASDGTDSNGCELAMTGKGNIFIGGGESPNNLRAVLQEGSLLSGETYTTTGERMYLSADSDLYLYSNANTITNRKMFHFTTDGALVVPADVSTTDNATNKTRNISLGTAATPSTISNGSLYFQYV